MNAYRMSVLTVLFIAGVAQAAWADDCSKISVTGSATRQLKPDVAYVTLYVNGDGVLMSDAAKKSDENVEAVLKAVREGRSNIVDIAVTTTDVGEKSSRVWSGDQQNASPRPQVSRQLRIVIPPDTALAYEIIDSAIRAGAILTRESMTHYSGEVRGTVIYGVKDASAVEEELKKEALEDARKQGEKTAQWAGKTLGPLCSVGCQSTTAWSQGMTYGGRSAEYPTKYVSADPSQIEIKASVSTTFELQEK
jgi:uncharacterized protein